MKTREAIAWVLVILLLIACTSVSVKLSLVDDSVNRLITKMVDADGAFVWDVNDLPDYWYQIADKENNHE